LGFVNGGAGKALSFAQFHDPVSTPHRVREKKEGRMVVEPDEHKTLKDLLQQVLLEYLLGSRAVSWPGADGLTEDDVVNCYPQAVADGEVPDCPELRRRHPELIPALQALWAAKGWRQLPHHDHLAQ
jgi:hypothetical protein